MCLGSVQALKAKIGALLDKYDGEFKIAREGGLYAKQPLLTEVAWSSVR